MKSSRHAKIIEIINSQPVETQEELANKLVEAGYKVTQATVSRDIRELKLMKVAEKGQKQRYAIFQEKENWKSDKYIRVLRDGFVSVDMAQNILVVKTIAGMAMAVGAALDALHWPEIVGCIAGDDTIFCAVRSTDDALVIMEKLKKIVQ